MINEKNYPEYFLLYVDNELSPAERHAVEAFVVAHPAYAAELKQLSEATLDAGEALSFGNKAKLHKSESGDIGIENYEDYFLRYTDNELSPTEKEATERFVLQHPPLQSAFVALQQTVLTPEKIDCPHKESLYKSEGKTRVLPRYFAPLSLAASLLLAVALVWQWQPVNAPVQKPADLALRQKPAPAAQQPFKTMNTGANDNKNETVHLAGKRQTDPQPESVKMETITKTTVFHNEPRTKQNQGETGETFARLLPAHPPVIAQAPPPASDEEPVSHLSSVAKTASLKLLEEVSEEEEKSLLAVYASQKEAAVQPAVYKELVTAEDEADQTLYVGSLQLNKAKVNGFLKSAAHVLGGRARQDNK